MVCGKEYHSHYCQPESHNIGGKAEKMKMSFSEHGDDGGFRGQQQVVVSCIGGHCHGSLVDNLGNNRIGSSFEFKSSQFHLSELNSQLQDMTIQELYTQIE